MTGRTRHYLDHNATAPLRPQALEAMLRAHAMPGNASSIHAEGRAARSLIEASRARIARFFGAGASHVIFTSGGSEANATVLSPGLTLCSGPNGCVRRPASLLLTSATEHPSVRDGNRFGRAAVETVPVDRAGRVDLGWLGDRLGRFGTEHPGETALVSLHLANNETGAVQPLRAVADLVHAHGGLVHADAVQAAGRIPVDIAALGVDVLTVSAHKLGGPKGIGAIILGDGALELHDKLIAGGGQERGWRAGTENVAGIAGFAAAVEAAAIDLAGESARLAGLRDRFESEVAAFAPETVFFAAGGERLPNTSAFATPGLAAESALIQLDLAGVAVSSGSACSSGKVRRSHVLDAMGVASELAAGALRISLGWSSTGADVEAFLTAYLRIAGAARARRAA